MRASSRREFLKLALATTLAVLAPLGAQAEEARIQLQRADLIARGEQYDLLGGYRLRLSNAMEEALHRGVTLYFVQRFEADRPRDYWLSEDIAKAKRTLRLSHNALLRNYQITGGGQQRILDSLPQALDSLGSLDDWPVMDRKPLKPDTLYRARVRMYLDTSLLPSHCRSMPLHPTGGIWILTGVSGHSSPDHVSGDVIAHVAAWFGRAGP